MPAGVNAIYQLVNSSAFLSSGRSGFLKAEIAGATVVRSADNRRWDFTHTLVCGRKHKLSKKQQWRVWCSEGKLKTAANRQGICAGVYPATSHDDRSAISEGWHSPFLPA
jgi:hypothetical protein